MRDEDEREFAAYVAARLPALLHFGYALSGNRDTAADLVQEAFVRLAPRWNRVRDGGDVEPYVRQTMVRLHISWWRRTRRETDWSWAPEVTAPPTSEPDDEVLQLMKELPRRQRSVLVLRYYLDMSEADIATTLQCSRGNVKSQAARGLAKLRALVEAKGDSI